MLTSKSENSFGTGGASNKRFSFFYSHAETLKTRIFYDEIVIGGGTAAALWLKTSPIHHSKMILLIAPEKGEPWGHRGEKPLAQPEHLISLSDNVNKTLPPDRFVDDPNTFISAEQYSKDLHQVIHEKGITLFNGCVNQKSIRRQKSGGFIVQVGNKEFYGKRVIIASGPGPERKQIYSVSNEIQTDYPKVFNAEQFLDMKNNFQIDKKKKVVVYGGCQAAGWCAQKVVENGDHLVWYRRGKSQNTVPYAPGSRGDQVERLTRGHRKEAVLINGTLQVFGMKVTAKFTNIERSVVWTESMDQFIEAIGPDPKGIMPNGIAAPHMMLSESLRNELLPIKDKNNILSLVDVQRQTQSEITQQQITLAVGTASQDLLLVGSSGGNHFLNGNYKQARQTLPPVLSPRFSIGMNRATIYALKNCLDFRERGAVNFNVADINTIAAYIAMNTNLPSKEANRWVTFIVQKRTQKPLGLSRDEILMYDRVLRYNIPLNQVFYPISANGDEFSPRARL